MLVGSWTGIPRTQNLFPIPGIITARMSPAFIVSLIISWQSVTSSTVNICSMWSNQDTMWTAVSRSVDQQHFTACVSTVRHCTVHISHCLPLYHPSLIDPLSLYLGVNRAAAELLWTVKCLHSEYRPLLTRVHTTRWWGYGWWNYDRQQWACYLSHPQQTVNTGCQSQITAAAVDRHRLAPVRQTDHCLPVDLTRTTDQISS